MKQTLGRLSKRTLALLLTLTMVLSLGITSACAEDGAANLLANGDFETTEGAAWNGDPVGWTCEVVTGDGSVWGEYKVKTGGTNNETAYLELSNYKGSGDMNAVATQTVSLEAGTYAASIQSAGANEGDSVSSLALTAVSGGTTLASSALTLGGWDTWTDAAITFTLAEAADVTVGVTGILADSSYCDLDNAVLTRTASAEEEGGSEEVGYAVTITPGTASVQAGGTVSLTAAVTYNGEAITDLSDAGLYLWWWTDVWAEGHTDGLSDAEYSNYDNNSGHSLTADVTLPSEGVYYIAAELKDDNGSLVTSFAVLTATAASAPEPVSAPIDVAYVSGLSDDFIMGVDISSVMAEFASGVTYRDFAGNTIDNITDFCQLLASCGVTHVRVRVWNDPYDTNGNGYGGGNNDLDTAVEIAKGCEAAGLKLLVDFHCSDFWTDPGKQQAPKAWADYTLEEKGNALAYFLKDSLEKIQATGAEIAMVQVGNETTGGFIGETGAANMCTLFQAGSEAVRTFDSDIQVVIHITNPEKGNLTAWAKNLDENEVDYDILATSYYPYWHGSLDNLQREMKAVQDTYGKDVMVAETSYAFTLDDTDGHDNTVRVGSNDTDMAYPFSVQGQADCIRDTIAAVSEAGGLGVFYWEPAWITVGDTTGLTGDDYDAQVAANQAVWERYGSGWASSYAAEYDPMDAGQWYGGSAVDNQALFGPDGAPLASLNVWKYVRTGAESQYVTVEAVENPAETIEEGGAYHLPETVLVTYNKGPQQETVAWDDSDVAAMDVNTPGVYVVCGTVTPDPKFDAEYQGEPTLTVTYTLTVKAKNLIGDDWSFENGADNFTGLDSTGKGIDGETPYDGSCCLHWYLPEAGTGTVTYLGENRKGITLAPGEYTFECVAQGAAGDSVTLQILLHGTELVLASGDAAPLSGWKVWQTPIVTVVVRERITVDLRMILDIQDGGWGTIDCLYLHGVQEEAGAEIPGLGVIITPAVDTPNSPMDFSDVKPGDWFYDDVKYVYENGLMNGTGGGKFSPNAALTRGMLVTILYRMEGAPATRYNGMFSDVANYQWYTDAVEWAAKNEIVNGYGGGKFGPGDPVTREQLATILFRYARYRGMTAVTLAENLTGFADADQTSSYAVSALNWAVGQGLVNGSDGKLLPQSNATRAQVAALIHRFLEG